MGLKPIASTRAEYGRLCLFVVAGHEAVDAQAAGYLGVGLTRGERRVERLHDARPRRSGLDLLSARRTVGRQARVVGLDRVGGVDDDLAAEDWADILEELGDRRVRHGEDHDLGTLGRGAVRLSRRSASRGCQLPGGVAAGRAHRHAVSCPDGRPGERLAHVPGSDDRDVHDASQVIASAIILSETISSETWVEPGHDDVADRRRDRAHGARARGARSVGRAHGRELDAADPACGVPRRRARHPARRGRPSRARSARRPSSGCGWRMSAARCA